MNKIITKQDLKEFVFPGVVGLICVFLWKNGQHEILIFLFFAILTQLYFATNKKEKITTSPEKTILSRSQLKDIAKKIEKISNK